MIASIKAEVRKLLTVRSTYVIAGITLALTALVAFYFEGYRGNTGSAASMLEPTALKEIVGNIAGLGAFFVSIIAVLFMGHEYRYNTIMYTLTANASRTQVYAAKVLVMSAFSVLFGLVVVLFGLGSYMLGLNLRDATLPAQDIELLAQLGKVMFYYVGYGLVGLLITVVVRSIVAAIAVLFIVPITVEPLLGLVLKEDAAYLPFAALDNVMGAALIGGITPARAMAVSALYLAAGVIIVWLLFVRRDAN